MTGPTDDRQYTDVLYEVEDPVATITLNRPEKLNSFTAATLAELRDAVGRAAADPAVVGIVITGVGRGFSAGLDSAQLSATAQQGSAARGEPSDEVPGLFTWLLSVDKPVIAAVNGVAAGGGFVLSVLCDVRFASTDAWFTTVFSKRGLIAEHGTTWIVPRLLGHGRALDLLWSSRRVDAEEALRIGLVEFVVPPDELLAAARQYVVDLAQQVSPASLADTKRLVYRHLGVGYEDAMREAEGVLWEAMDRPDATEGVQSLLERRPPEFPRLGSTPQEGTS
jgi:enoyl-CoA hydratase/carnithine racemase